MNKEIDHKLDEKYVLKFLADLKLDQKEVVAFRKKLKNQGIEAVLPDLIELYEKDLNKEKEELIKSKKKLDEVYKGMNTKNNKFDEVFDKKFEESFEEEYKTRYELDETKNDSEIEKEMDKIDKKTIQKINNLEKDFLIKLKSNKRNK